MLEKLIKRKFYLQKHLDMPLLYERESYLGKMLENGLSANHVKATADYLLLMVEMFSMTDEHVRKVTLKEIDEKGDQWAGLIKNHPMKRTPSASSKGKFFCIALNWLDSIGRLDSRCNPGNNILSRIFSRGFYKVRYLTYPMLEERCAYISMWESCGAAVGTLRKIAQHQMHAIDLLHPQDGRVITLSELADAADTWKKSKNKAAGKEKDTIGSHKNFLNIVSGWLEFMEQLEQVDTSFFEGGKVNKYLRWLTSDKGYSSRTAETRFCMLKLFMSYLQDGGIMLSAITPLELDAYLSKRHDVDGCSRKTIAGTVSVLRDFLRYAEFMGWCQTGLSKSLNAPRVYAMEDIPSFIQWDEIRNVISSHANRTNPSVLRNHAVLMLLATYGLRSSEVANLKLKDIDWRKKEIYLHRAKNCKPQIMPLMEEVASAIALYVTGARRNESNLPSLFITSRAPYKGIGTSTVYQIASNALEGKNLNIRHHGPHSYRHSCATHLVNTGHTIKEIADILGHQQLDTTRIYAKVDLVSLRKVSDMNWEEVL